MTIVQRSSRVLGIWAWCQKRGLTSHGNGEVVSKKRSESEAMEMNRNLQRVGWGPQFLGVFGGEWEGLSGESPVGFSF